MLPVAHRAVGTTLFWLGAEADALTHFTQGLTLYNVQQHQASAFLHGEDAGVTCRVRGAWALWCLGYSEQGLAWSHEAIALAQQIAHPHSLGFALGNTALLHQLRREVHAAEERAEATISLAMQQGFSYFMADGAILHGWALTHQGQVKEGIEQMHQGLIAFRATGAELLRPYYLALLAEAHSALGEPETGLTGLVEALTLVDKTGEQWCESELHRLKGELLLQQNSDNATKAETCFQHAITIAQSQGAKAWELRAATSMARLWQQQGKRQEAHDLLAPVYGWFTEGFDTADLQEAKALLQELEDGR
jgi:adenylate cyclase